jgi:hypothetical protein
MPPQTNSSLDPIWKTPKKKGWQKGLKWYSTYLSSMKPGVQIPVSTITKKEFHL